MEAGSVDADVSHVINILIPDASEPSQCPFQLLVLSVASDRDDEAGVEEVESKRFGAHLTTGIGEDSARGDDAVVSVADVGGASGEGRREVCVDALADFGREVEEA